MADDVKAIRKEENEMLKLIDERDNAEQFASHIYFLVTGRSPEWSNHFGYPEATEEIDDSLRVLRKVAKMASN